MKPDLSLVICTFERPENLSRVLASVLSQTIDHSRIEVIVADDGSRDQTPDIVKQFASTAPFPVRFVTHPHAGFCPSRCRNEGVAASSGEYIVLLDGDCMIPPQFLAIQQRLARPSIVRIGDCIRLTEKVSSKIDSPMAERGGYRNLITWRDRLAMWKIAFRDTKHAWRNDPIRPVLTSNNIGIWRADYDRVNGFDEAFVGWGAEDRDFGLRLRKAGVSLRSILWHTAPVHLWHPPVPSHPVAWNQGVNMEYHQRPARLTRCTRGITKRKLADLKLLVLPSTTREQKLAISPWIKTNVASTERPEIEILVASSGKQFSGSADCNVLIAPQSRGIDSQLLARAHYVLSPATIAGISPEQQLPLDGLDQLLASIIDPTQSARKHRQFAA